METGENMGVSRNFKGGWRRGGNKALTQGTGVGKVGGVAKKMSAFSAMARRQAASPGKARRDAGAGWRLAGAVGLAMAIVAEGIAASLVWVNNPWYNVDDLGNAAGYNLALFMVPACLGLVAGGVLWGVARLLAPRPLLPKWFALLLGALVGVLPFVVSFVALSFFDVDT